MDAIHAELVHRSLSDAAGRKTSRDFDDRLAQSIMPLSEPPFLDAPYNFCLPKIVFETKCKCTGHDTDVEEALENLGLPAMRDQGLRPIHTTGDGDCLLHAVCIAIWGFHDRQVRLRTVLVEWVLSPSLAPVLKDIFFRGEKKDDAAIGAEREPSQLEQEWETQVVGNATGSREYLSRFHVFILANILRRPIVVLADPYVRGPDGSIFSPLQMRGIYLPSLAPREDRSTWPIVIMYTVTKGCQGHFTALVGVDEVGRWVPLQDSTSLFPTPYVEDVDLDDYFNVVNVRTASGARVVCARLPVDPPMTPESHKIRCGLLKKASMELQERAAAILTQAEEAKKQALREDRRAQEAEQRLMADNTLEDEPDDMQGIRLEDRTLENRDTTGAQGRYDTDMAMSPPDDGFINPLRASPDTGIRTGTRTAFSRAEDHAWGPIRRIPIMGLSNIANSRTPSPPRPLLNPLQSSRQGGLTRQNAHNSQQYGDFGVRLDDPFRDMMASGLLSDM